MVVLFVSRVDMSPSLLALCEAALKVDLKRDAKCLAGDSWKGATCSSEDQPRCSDKIRSTRWGSSKERGM